MNHEDHVEKYCDEFERLAAQIAQTASLLRTGNDMLQRIKRKKAELRVGKLRVVGGENHGEK